MAKNALFYHFDPGIRGMGKNDLAYLKGNFTRNPKM